jgi:hypothetical protein
VSESREQLRQRIDQAKVDLDVAAMDARQQVDEAAASARSKWAQLKADAADAIEFAAWTVDHARDGARGHQPHRGSAMGAHYRHTTPEMAARIAAAVEQRLTVVSNVAEQALEAQPHRSTQRVF